MIAVIGGTGIGNRLQQEAGLGLRIPTQFGLARAKRLDWAVAFARHSEGHRVGTQAVDYPAIAAGVKALGCRACVSTAAVGAVHKNLKPGDLAVCTDFVDLTQNRPSVFASQPVHTDFSQPFDPELTARLMKEVPTSERCVYACTSGPRYETPAEIACLQSVGCDVVGMTASSEAIAMREIGVPYACVCIVTNYAAGVSDHNLSHTEVEQQMSRSAERVIAILKKLAADFV